MWRAIKQAGWLYRVGGQGRRFCCRGVAFAPEGSEGEGITQPGRLGKVVPTDVRRCVGVPRRQVRPEQSGAEREDVKLGEDGGRGAERRAREPAVRLERFGFLSRGAAPSEDTQSPSSGQSSKKFRSQNHSHPATVIGGGF